MTQCAVHRLRVAAASEPAARRFVATLEDALRCATLPGDDRRVVVVRRLALGRVAHDAGAQGLGLLIEQRLARGEIAWAAADSPPDARGDAVGFAGALEARVALARRLVRGEPCDAWYWPLAVREFRRDQLPRDALLLIGQAIAALPEARVALPQWIAQVVEAGGTSALHAAIDEPAARALLRAARIAWPVDVPASTTPRQRRADPAGVDMPRAAAGASGQTSRTARESTAASMPTRPAWLNAVLARAYGGTSPSDSGATPVRDDGRAAARTRAAPSAIDESARSTGRVGLPSQALPDSHDASPATPVRAPTPHSQESPSPPLHAATPARASGASPDADGHWQPTACGGLLFLLPVLAHAGLVRGHDPDVDRIAALFVLRAALRRVRAADDDVAWALVADLPVLRPSEAHAAEERALRDLEAARRWLHRRARLGIVALVRRPARLAFTATHIDVRFPLAGADVRVRRAGLDIDPGWLPWFGRVVAFQFVGRLP